MGVERLYYTDAYLREFTARIVRRQGRQVHLDRTAFYPGSGGQLCDTGTINGVAVTEVAEEDAEIAHVTEAPVAGEEVHCRIDWPRRFDHMQQHTGQHLLSAMFAEMYGIATVSVHLGGQASTIDLDIEKLSLEQASAAELRANQTVVENRPVAVTFEENPAGLRKPSEREGPVRVVTIADLDRSACGGTHVRATGEIGPILLRKAEKIRNTVRVEFLCGLRAVRRARLDYNALTSAAQVFSSSLEEVPGLVSTQREQLEAAARKQQRLEEEVARYRGRELYEATTADAGGIRRAVRRLAVRSDDLRLLAQSFTAHPQAIFIGVVEEPPSILLAASADSGLDAGRVLKQALTAAGGRGGGSARIAQGSLSDRNALDRVLESLFLPPSL